MKTLYLLLFLITAIASGCVPGRTVPRIESRTIPADYGIHSDSANAATINWRTYFSDANLTALIDTALANNLDSRIALQRIEGSKAEVQFRKGPLLPVVALNGTAAVRRYGLYTMDGAGNSTTDILPGQIVPVNLPDYFVGLQTAWEADIWNKLHNRRKGAVARYLASIEGRSWLVTNIIAELASSYYELVGLDIELDIIRETIALQENGVAAVTVQREVGAANELAVKQFRAQLINSKAMEYEARQRIIQTESKINYLLGRYPQPIIRSKDLFPDSVTIQLLSGIPSDLLRNRADIKQAELEMMATKADLRAARAAFYPSLQIAGGIGYQAFKTKLLFTSPESFVFSLVGGLSAPLINRNAIKAEFKSASAQQVEAMYNYQRSILNGFVEVYNELNNIQNLQSISKFKREQSAVLYQAIENASDLFQSGRATYIEVLIAQQNALQARLDFVEARKHQLFARVNLYKALGGGWRN